MDNYYFLLSLIIFFNLMGVFLVYLRKGHLEEMSVYHVAFITSCFFVLFNLLVLCYNFKLDDIVRVYKQKLSPSFLASLCLAAALSSLMFFIWLYLVKKYPLSKFIPLKTGLNVLLLSMLGFMAYKEEFSLQNIVGISLVIAGIMVLGEIKH